MLSLVPSQVSNSIVPTKRRARSKAASQILSPQLIPSQVRLARRKQCTDDLCRQMLKASMPEVAISSNFTSAEGQEVTNIKSRRLTRRNKRESNSSRNSNVADSSIKKQSKKNQKKKVLKGNLPDINWRAIPWDHLRCHPHFEPLPPAEMISSLELLEDARKFRQESWQWDALHEGRCTTSQVAAALGLLEPKAGKALGIPLSWRRGGMSAYYRLQGKAIRSLEEMNAMLCSGRQLDKERLNGKKSHKPSRFWVVPRSHDASRNEKRYPFAAKYVKKLTPKEREQRRKTAQRHAAAGTFMSVRMSWGNAQEATALLTALNFFWESEPQIRVQEVGMCGAGLNVAEKSSDSLLVGASPDAILRYPNGTIEALEVKNHCPFVSAHWGKQHESQDDCKEQYMIRHMPFREPRIPPLYIPQLMMEMLCIGPECRSAIMVRQTATNGAIILRLHRHDAWLDEMMYWLSKFQNDFVERDAPPPKNFFWENDEHGERYRRFVNWTKEMGLRVDLLHHVKHDGIQRAMASPQCSSSLFLD